MITEDQKFEYKTLNSTELNDEFVFACKKGDIETVQYLLTSLDFQEKININTLTENEIKVICRNNNLEILKYLLTSDEIKEHIDIHFKNDFILVTACQFGHLEMVKYLLISPELKEHANIFDNSGAFRIACQNGCLEIVKFILTITDLEKINDGNSGFKWACITNKTDVINYLIFDYGIKLNDEIFKFIKDNNKKDIENLFLARELNKKLENKEIQTNKIKI